MRRSRAKSKAEVLAEFGGGAVLDLQEGAGRAGVAQLGPIAAEIERLMADPAEIDRILADGAARARAHRRADHGRGQGHRRLRALVSSRGQSQLSARRIGMLWAASPHGSMARMSSKKKRRSFEAGHFRKFLLIVDESMEVESALYYAASRIQHSSGSIVMLYVIEPQEFQHWIDVRQQQVEEETTKAKALFRLFRRKLNLAGFENVACEEIIREGDKAEEIRRLIDEDEDIAILVLGASNDPTGPGRSSASLPPARRRAASRSPSRSCPGTLALEDIQALA